MSTAVPGENTISAAVEGAQVNGVRLIVIIENTHDGDSADDRTQISRCKNCDMKVPVIEVLHVCCLNLTSFPMLGL